MAANQDTTGQMLLAQSLEELKPLYQMCREGRLDDVARWIDEGKPPQVAPQAVAKGTRPVNDHLKFPWASRTGTWAIEALLACRVRWEETNPGRIADIRRLLLKLSDYDLKTIMSRLRRPEICAPETYAELIRTSSIQGRLLALGLMKKPVNERERRRNEFMRLASRYDRTTLYEQVWSQPVQTVANTYRISGVMFGKVCRKLQVPVPPRGYWARVQNGYKMKKPSSTKLSIPSLPSHSPDADRQQRRL